jgi:hypothetical protein
VYDDAVEDKLVGHIFHILLSFNYFPTLLINEIANLSQDGLILRLRRFGLFSVKYVGD